MRTLKTSMKADFIRSHKVEQTPHGSSGSQSRQAIAVESTSDHTSPTDDSKELEANVPIETSESASTKRSRPRSRTFTFSRSDKGGSSPTKKQKADSTAVNIPKSPSSTSLAKSTSSTSSFLSKLQKPAVPEEYVSYLRKVQDPKEVEVGKMHKLRLLLRNETVQWVVTFITLGGMTEIVGLLHRIILVEWRYVFRSRLLCLESNYLQ
jgi:hypothetical protein